MPRWPQASPRVIGLLVGLCILALFHLAPTEWARLQQERVFDTALRLVAPLRRLPPVPRVVHVDIDQASLQALGVWPWQRETLAGLIQRITAAAPAAVALDVVFVGDDTQSPAALARRLGDKTGRADIRALAASLPDGDKALAAAMNGKPVILGWVLDPHGFTAPPAIPVFTRGAPHGLGIWRAPAASAPGEQVAGAAVGAGTVSLPGDPDGVVRRVPMLVSVAGELHPGFAAEVLRVARGASGYILSTEDGRMRIGDQDLAFPFDGLLRLSPGLNVPVARRISAADIASGSFATADLADAIVIVGGTAPETGGLRPSIDDPLTPSSMIHAMAFRQLAAGIIPVRPPHARLMDIAASLLVLVLAIGATHRLRPLPAVVVCAGLIGSLALLALAAAFHDVLLDPAPGILAGSGGFAAMLIGAFSQTRQREAQLRRRFEQHLAPGVVKRIIADPESLRLTGERRIVTALFTDIEGFTTTARDTDPVRLIAVLDGYFEGVSRIIVDHGGMIDKFVGDAVHAFFNIPFDLDGHAARAIACAQAIAAWAETYRLSGLPGEIGLGRTRIGLETGEAVAGDVGLSTKLDYTAHGSAVNLAARLEAMNKEFGTTILIGPEAARAVGQGLQPMGRHEIRGFGTLDLFTVPAS